MVAEREDLLGRRYEVAAPDVVAEDFGGEIVVLNLANGKYFSLTGFSATVWRDLVAGHQPQVLVGLAPTKAASLREALEALVVAIVGESLIRERRDPTPPALPPTAVFDEATVVLPMESYDDMADLILSDPIHEVEEEIGWPRKREDTSRA